MGLPTCGCDACDEPVGHCTDALHEYIEVLTAGAVGERLVHDRCGRHAGLLARDLARDRELEPVAGRGRPARGAESRDARRGADVDGVDGVAATPVTRASVGSRPPRRGHGGPPPRP